MQVKIYEWILQDWSVNRNSPENRLILAWFRLAQWAYRHWGIFGRFAVVLPYRLVTTLFLSMEIPVTAQIGPRLRLPHKHGLVIHVDATLGKDCCLRHGVTLGSKLDQEGRQLGVPLIGDGVDFGAGCVVVGDVSVGNHARIGALTIVTHSVPDYAVVVGNPGRVIKIDRPMLHEGREPVILPDPSRKE